jgi:hypothetical protein
MTQSEKSYSGVLDKTDWGPGPWHDEPDKLQWIDDATGFDCLIVRANSGALCGYVGVGPGHPLHGSDYCEVDVDVHGGLTYSAGCDEGRQDRGICHVPAPGRPADVWWLGFDCAHFRDVRPADDAVLARDGAYRSIEYVRAECRKLARQLAAVKQAR